MVNSTQSRMSCKSWISRELRIYLPFSLPAFPHYVAEQMLQVIWCCAECRLPQIGRRLGHSDAQRSLCSYEKLSVPHRTLHCNDANTNKEPSLSDFTGVGFQGNIKLFVKLAPHQLTHTRFHSRIAHRLHFIHNVILKYEAQRSHESLDILFLVYSGRHVRSEGRLWWWLIGLCVSPG